MVPVEASLVSMGCDFGGIRKRNLGRGCSEPWYEATLADCSAWRQDCAHNRRQVNAQLYATEPLDAGKEYRLLVGDFLLSGGDGYTMLRDGCRHGGHTVELLSRSMCAWHGLLVQDLHSDLVRACRQVERSNKARQPHGADDRYGVRVVSRSGAGPFTEPGRNRRLCTEAAGFS